MFFLERHQQRWQEFNSKKARASRSLASPMLAVQRPFNNPEHNALHTEDRLRDCSCTGHAVCDV